MRFITVAVSVTFLGTLGLISAAPAAANSDEGTMVELVSHTDVNSMLMSYRFGPFEKNSFVSFSAWDVNIEYRHDSRRRGC